MARRISSGQPVSIRLSDKLMEELNAASSELDMQLHETMRQAMKVGLEDFRRIGYQLAGAVVDAAKTPQHQEISEAISSATIAHLPPPPELSRAAETPDTRGSDTQRPTSYPRPSRRKKA